MNSHYAHNYLSLNSEPAVYWTGKTHPGKIPRPRLLFALCATPQQSLVTPTFDLKSKKIKQALTACYNSCVGCVGSYVIEFLSGCYREIALTCQQHTHRWSHGLFCCCCLPVVPPLSHPLATVASIANKISLTELPPFPSSTYLRQHSISRCNQSTVHF